MNLNQGYGKVKTFRGIICPSPVGIGLADLPNIGGASGTPGSGIPVNGTDLNHTTFSRTKSM